MRDRLLGLPVQDRDHVVVGATVDDMLAAGFKPVGRDFPVFLHPETREEYALARTERKVARGYAGFTFHCAPDVTLEDDLARRDLTINAMAEDDVTGAIVDPFGGRLDLEARLFRHVGPAFVEDPVRILRLARFAARFVDFHVVDATVALMRAMVDAGEVDALVAERVWQEMARGLLEARPSRMLAVLASAGAWQRLLPELAAPPIDIDALGQRLDQAARRELPLSARTALLLGDIVADDAGERVGRVCRRLGMPRAVRDVCVLVAGEAQRLRGRPADKVDPAGIVGALERADAFRRPERARDVIAALALVVDDPALEAHWSRALEAASAIDAGALAKSAAYDPAQVRDVLQRSRIAAVNEWRASPGIRDSGGE